MHTLASLAIVLLVTLAACSARTPTAADAAVAVGAWGGDHVRLTIEPAAATIEFDCAHGALPTPIPLQDDAFDVLGTLVFEHSGPIQPGEELPEQPARYSGSVHGQKMTLQVALTKPAQDVGTYSLRLGSAARLFKCL